MRVETTIWDYDNERQLTVSGSYSVGLPGYVDQFGVPETPDDPPEWVDVLAEDEDGLEVDLDDDIYERACEALTSAMDDFL